MKTRTLQAVVKLGGSAISWKTTGKPTPKREILEQVASEIASARTTCIVVHGGGSYGHPLAERYHIADGFKSPKQFRGIPLTHRAMVSLNEVVVETLAAAGVPVLSVSPWSCFTTDNGRIVAAHLESIVAALDFGFVPVLYGDVAFDRKLGFTILSGDQIASYLAQALGAKRLVFALKVDGVYTKEPGSKGARLVRKLNLESLEDMAKVTSARTGGSDVTGGMRRKLFESVPAVRAGIAVCFAGVTLRGNIRSAIKGKRFRGTLVEGSAA